MSGAVLGEPMAGAIEDGRDLVVGQRIDGEKVHERCAYCGGGKIDQRVDRALQDMRGGQRVDLLGPLCTAHVGRNHRPFNGLRRPSLIPKKHWQVERRQVACEGPDRLRARTVAAVHIER